MYIEIINILVFIIIIVIVIVIIITVIIISIIIVFIRSADMLNQTTIFWNSCVTWLRRQILAYVFLFIFSLLKSYILWIKILGLLNIGLF